MKVPPTRLIVANPKWFSSQKLTKPQALPPGGSARLLLKEAPGLFVRQSLMQQFPGLRPSSPHTLHWRVCQASPEPATNPRNALSAFRTGAFPVRAHQARQSASSA